MNGRDCSLALHYVQICVTALHGAQCGGSTLKLLKILFRVVVWCCVQGTFPHGIDILTTVDYYAVGTRSFCYLELR